MKTRIASLIGLMVIIGLLNATISFGQIDLYEYHLAYTGGVQRDYWPSTRLLKDSLNNIIVARCVEGRSLAELQALGIDDLAQRLKLMVEKHLLQATDTGYIPGLPVIIGWKRAFVDSVVDAHMPLFAPTVDSIVAELRSSPDFPQEQLFHILWSRVMDVNWWDAWQHAFPDEPGPTDVIWIIYPWHPFTVGTNKIQTPGDGLLFLTWSPNCDNHLSTLSDLLYEINLAAWEREITNTQAIDTLQYLGLLDAELHFTPFSPTAEDAVNSRLHQLSEMYIDAVADSYDYRALGEKLGIHYNDLFLILLHETAYGLLEHYDKSGTVTAPEIIWGAGDPRQVSFLVSLARGNPPSMEDEAMALFMKNGWHGNREIIDKFREILTKDPQKVEITLFLGLSLYDVEDYQEAISVFRKLGELTGTDESRRQLHDWSSIWVGHIYDEMGLRDKALTEYRRVLTSPDSVNTQQFGQYGIGPINAKEWAKERIKEPFTRK